MTAQPGSRTPTLTRRLVLAGGISTVGATLLVPAPAHAASLTAAQLTARLKAYQRTRGGTFSVALYDCRNGKTFTYQGTWRNETLSIIKVLILATVLRRCQERKVNLTTAQRAQAKAMITRSDNTATNALLTWAGVSNVRRVAGLYGLKSTVIQGGTTAGATSW
ncbi:serine hydrolase [Flexivirga caeni]|nr:serine hydrolase [Flexivirga caeni]